MIFNDVETGFYEKNCNCVFEKYKTAFKIKTVFAEKLKSKSFFRKKII